MSGGGGNTQSTSSTQNPWSGQQPFLTDIYNQAKSLESSSTPQYFPGQTIAAQSPETQQAQQATAARALAGSPDMAAANQFNQDVLGGQYLQQGNPYLGQVYGNIQSQVLPSIMGVYNAAGRNPGDSASFAETAARGLGSALAPYAFGDYQNQLQLMNQQSQLSPTLANQDYTDLGQLAAVGQQRDTYGQNLLNSNIDRWNYNQNIPSMKLGQYAQLIQGGYNPGGQTITKTPVTSPLPALLGGLLGGIL